MLKVCVQLRQNILNPIRLYATKSKCEMKYLNVAEKNDAAKTIAGLLSNGSSTRREGLSVYNKIYEFETTVKGTKSKMVMTSVSGHLLHLEFLFMYKNWKNCDPMQLFDAPIRSMCLEDHKPIRGTLEREIKSCQGLIIWTDCDREGESIGFEIIDVCRAVKPNITIYRAKFSEITSGAVRRALDNLTQPDQRQKAAVDVRTELDLRTGAAITRLQTLRLQRLFPEKIADKLISYGSCQIPTLGFVADRYKEIEAFVSEPFWKIRVLHTIDDLTVEFHWARNRLFDKESCEDYLMLCLADPTAKVEDVVTKPKNKWRPTPMDTVQLEKLGSRKLKLSAKETMTIAEKLYTQGIISYPRTETNMFSKEIDLKRLVEFHIPDPNWGDFARRVIEWGPNPRNGTKSDQAHPPIHPTKLVTNLTGNEGRVYELVVRHFLACVSKDATGSETKVTIDIAGEKFTATGLCIFERNYLDVYIYETWNAKQIHHYEVGQTFEPTEISMHEGATMAPPLLTEADLIALMEKHEIGTDATHAEHINTIKERGYIGVVDKGFLVPGKIGMGLYEGYNAMELVLAKPDLRAQFEADLKKICLGEKDPKLVLREQIEKYKEAYKVIIARITKMDEKMAERISENPNLNGPPTSSIAPPNTIQEVFECPKCRIASLGLKQKKDKPGYYLGCMNFPDCKNAVWFPDELKDISLLDEVCARCGNTAKKLRVKLVAAYYKSLFDAPDGWYNTCLRCDQRFRETFNINTDSVKRVGAIVSDSNRNTTQTRSTVHATSRNVNNNRTPNASADDRTNHPPPNANKNVRNTNASGSSTSSSSRNQGDRGDGTSGKNKPKRQPKTKPIASSVPQANIRQFSTNAQTSTTSEHHEIETLDAFFGDDDEFDEVLLNADLPIDDRPSDQTETSVTDTFDTECFFEDDNFEDYSWGTRGSRATPKLNQASNQMVSRSEYQNTRPSTSSFSRLPSATNTNSSSENAQSTSNFRGRDNQEQFQWGTHNSRVNRSYFSNDTNADEPIQWGTGGSTQRPNSSRSQSENQGWGSQTSRAMAPSTSRAANTAIRNQVPAWNSSENPTRNNTSNVEVKCTGCHQVAKELVTKKEGPNQGRVFYVCPKPKQCKFFMWADDVIQSDAFDNDDDEVVNCKCNKPSLSLIARKDGPNKGRRFHSCGNPNKKCDFFQWANNDNVIQALEASWGGRKAARTTSANTDAPSSSSKTENSQGDSRKRKCGICRQEGHTRNKCPRKAEFDI